jgi:hypothetical protein
MGHDAQEYVRKLLSKLDQNVRVHDDENATFRASSGVLMYKIRLTLKYNIP